MKKYLLIASLVLGINFLADSQITKRSPEQRAQHITKILKKRLALTDDQAKQIQAVFYLRATRMDSLITNRTADNRQNHRAARSIMQSTERNVMAVLNGTQKQQFMAWIKTKKERHKERMEAMGSKI